MIAGTPRENASNAGSSAGAREATDMTCGNASGDEVEKEAGGYATESLGAATNACMSNDVDDE